MNRSLLSPIRALVLPALLALLLGGCADGGSPAVSASVIEAMSAPNSAGYARALEPRPFEFPRDHGAHPDYRTEWWYYTGNLTAENGDEYGYQLTFFRSALTPAMQERSSTLASNQVYMAHFAVSDGAEGEHRSFDRYSRGAGGLAGAQDDPNFAIWLEDWSVTQPEPGTFRLTAATETEDGPVAIDLTLRESRPPLLHGVQGLHQKGPEAGNASYYYSLVNLETTGTVTTPAGTRTVTGRSWMDHEFGTSALSGDALGWDWFSLQLDNGAALMLYTIRTRSGAVQAQVKGTLLLPDDSTVKLRAEDFAIVASKEWTSPRSGATYPVAWRVSVPEQALELEVTTPIADQEMDVTFLYWEGMVNARGTMAGAPVTGRGYVELTGYGASAGEYQR